LNRPRGSFHHVTRQDFGGSVAAFMPTSTDMFGTQFVGAIHGRLLIA
jgi:hypothetical protein